MLSVNDERFLGMWNPRTCSNKANFICETSGEKIAEQPPTTPGKYRHHRQIIGLSLTACKPLTPNCYSVGSDHHGKKLRSIPVDKGQKSFQGS